MRASLLIPLTACWTSSVAPVVPAPKIATASCEIHDHGMVPAGPVGLSVRGMQYARLYGPVGRLDVLVKGGAAEAKLESSELELGGELELEALPVRPRQIELRDGWLEISRAVARRSIEEILEIEVPLPSGVEPHTMTAHVHCDQLTFALPPPTPLSKHEEIVELQHGKTRLRETPAGRVVATAVVPTSSEDGASIDGRVLERRGSWVHLRIGDDGNAIVVWVPATSVTEPGGLGVGGFSKGTDESDVVTCTRDVALYVTIHGEETQVGTLKAHAQAHPRGAIAKGRLAIELGGHDLTPYVKDVAACSVSAPPKS